jgi:hypothetical protein
MQLWMLDALKNAAAIRLVGCTLIAKTGFDCTQSWIGNSTRCRASIVPGEYCSSCHRMPFSSRNEGSKCVG